MPGVWYGVTMASRRTTASKTHILLIWERTHRIPRKGENQSKEEHQAATSSIMRDFETWCRCEL